MPVYPQSKPNLTLAGLLRSSEGTVGATMWPTRALATRERLFDELYVWTEGYQPTTMRRARLQILALRKAFALLEFQRVDRICVTLSFGTVERALDPATDIFETNRLLAHRSSVMLRGQVERLRSPYRVQSFVEWLRTQAVPVGYRLSASRIGAERKAIELLQPGFAKPSGSARAARYARRMTCLPPGSRADPARQGRANPRAIRRRRLEPPSTRNPRAAPVRPVRPAAPARG